MKKAQVAIKSQKNAPNNKVDDNDGLCVVCFCKVEIYSIGDCDHPVCYECSTRMRVLIERNECPICRKELAQVVFIDKKSLALYNTLNTRTMSFERRYAIYFETDKEMAAYDRLLEHPCPVCPPNNSSFKNFLALKDHMVRTHQMFYCELCLAHLKIFSRDRRAYTRTDLAQHRRKGDTDDTSHRGHPLCQFCDTRFMDDDELYRHLRKEHFYCHFCDADGLHQYYADYPALRLHFNQNHFLCEEGDCRDEQFTSVFRNKLDMQAHYLEAHAGAGNKAAMRQARTVDIQFTVNHAPAVIVRGVARGRGGRGGGRGRGRGGDEPPVREEPSLPPPPQQNIDINCAQNFPSLGATGESGAGVGKGQPSGGGASGGRSFTVRAMRGNVAAMTEEFPMLGSRPNTSINVTTSNSGNNSNSATNNTSTTTSVHLKVNSKKGGGGGTAGGGGAHRGGAVSIQYNRTSEPTGAHSSCSTGFRSSTQVGNITLKSRANNNMNGNKENAAVEDFPTLGNPSKNLGDTFRTIDAFTSASAPVYSSRKAPLTSNVTSTKASNNTKMNGKYNGNEKKMTKNDFPSLSTSSTQDPQLKNYSGMSKVTVPVNNSWTKTTDYLPQPKPAPAPRPQSAAPDAAASTKANKKKKGNSAQAVNLGSNFSFGSNNSSSSFSTKKRPLRLGNVFDDSDDEEEVVETTFGHSADLLKKTDYKFKAAAPEASSNMKMLSAEAFEARKKSELKIGSLKTPKPVLHSLGDFPSLGGGPSSSSSGTAFSSNNNSGGNNKKKGGSNKASGTSSNSSSEACSGTPWAATVTSKKSGKNASKSSNFSNTDMTFHSSYGEAFSISPTEDSSRSSSRASSAATNGNSKSAKNNNSKSTANGTSKSASSSSTNKSKKDKSKKAADTVYQFIYPPDFERRNQQLIQTISELCGGNTDKFNQFKKLSGELRKGSVGGRDYYQQCRQLMGRPTMLKMLPELLVLLPDISIQQAVLQGFKQLDDKGCNTSTANEDLQFVVCETCSQVLSQGDQQQHMAQHATSFDEFPSLSSVRASLYC